MASLTTFVKTDLDPNPLPDGGYAFRIRLSALVEGDALKYATTDIDEGKFSRVRVDRITYLCTSIAYTSNQGAIREGPAGSPLAVFETWPTGLTEQGNYPVGMVFMPKAFLEVGIHSNGAVATSAESTWTDITIWGVGYE